MDSAAGFGRRHALHPVHAGFVFQPCIDIAASDARDQFAQAAQFAPLLLDDVERPALRLGIALIHAQKVAGEQRRFLAAGAGADFQHCGAGIGSVAGQQRQLQRVLDLRQGVAQARKFLGGEAGHLGIVEQRLGLLDLGAQRMPGADLRHDRLELRIFARDRRDLVGRGGGIEPRFEILEPVGDLGKAVMGQHGGRCGARRRARQGPSAASSAAIQRATRAALTPASL